MAYHDPIVEGAPGHGEGHNSGVPLNITAVLALKKIMEREKLPGTLMLWPGAAEGLLGTKAYYVRDGYFKNVDACIFPGVLVTTRRKITLSPKSLFVSTFCRRIENRSFYKASIEQVKRGLHCPPMRLFVASH